MAKNTNDKTGNLNVKNESTKVKTTETLKPSKSDSQTTQTTTNKPKQEENKKEQTSIQNQETTTKTETSTTPKEDTKKIQCTASQHLLETGNTGKWFNTKQEAINYYNQTYSKWGTKWENFEIDDNTFHKNCPNRYEIFQCICGKWTIDFFYEY